MQGNLHVPVMLQKSPLLPLTVLYLLMPPLLFAVGWLRTSFALFHVAALLCFVGIALRQLVSNWRAYTPAEWRLFFFIASSLTLWVFFSGTGGFGFQTTDYRASNALLKDLIEQDWPIHLYINGAEEKYVYYMAYYLPAAMVGKKIGWAAANYFLVAWTSAGVLLSFFWFLKISRVKTNHSFSKFIGLLVMFCLAGGLDLFGTFFFRNDIFRISNQNEWWAGYFQYSSATTLIYWVPQQTIAIWMLTGMIVDSVFDDVGVNYLGMVSFSALLWSPLGLIGVVPFAILSAAFLFSRQKGRRSIPLSGWLLNVLSLLVGVAYVLYIASNQLKFPIAFVWDGIANSGRLFNYLLAFWVLEFALLAVLVLLFVAWTVISERNPGGRGIKSALAYGKQKLFDAFDMDMRQIYFFALSLVVLFALPVFRVGVYNDFVMRSSIPALFVFWAVISKIALDASIRARVRHNLLYSLILAVIILGFYPALRGISDSIRKYHAGPPPFESVSDSAEANSREIVEQRVGSGDSPFYQYISK